MPVGLHRSQIDALRIGRDHLHRVLRAREHDANVGAAVQRVQGAGLRAGHATVGAVDELHCADGTGKVQPHIGAFGDSDSCNLASDFHGRPFAIFHVEALRHGCVAIYGLNAEAGDEMASRSEASKCTQSQRTHSTNSNE